MITAKKLFGFLTVSLFALGAFAMPAAALDDAAFTKMMDKYLEDEKNLDKVGKALEGYFKKKRESQQKNAAAQEKKKIEEQFKNPVKVNTANNPSKGPKDAKVTVVEFSDFQCPFCKRGMDVMYDLLKEYPNDVKVVFKHLPLPFHPEAKPAALAAMAAGEQGKFWEMHDELFENQSSLGQEGYIAMAKKLGLDIDKFKADMESEKLKKIVEDDAAEATKLGIRGTPGFFVNGVQVRGARPLPYFKELVDRWLSEGKKS